MELLLPLGLWLIIVACAPFGIWAAKSRLTRLEDEVMELRRKLDQLTVAKPSPRPVATPQPTSMATYLSPTSEKPQPEPAVQRTPYAPPASRPQLADVIKQADTAAVTPEQKAGDAPPPAAAPGLRTSPADTIRAAAASSQSTSHRKSEPFGDDYSANKHARDFRPSVSGGASSPLFGWLAGALTGGRLFVTLGMGLLFIGVAMLLKYVAHTIVIPLELRFLGVALAACGMIAFGHAQVASRRDFGLYMQGGGLGILFLTVFTAFKFYSLLSPGVAFTLLIAIGAATFLLSIRNNSLGLSVMATTGGFIAPLMTSTGHGSYIALFSYYLLLNLVIFAIAWIKPWRALTTVGFFFTFAIGLLWGGQYYVPEFYPVVQSFLIIYFLLYTCIGILYAARSAPNMAHPVDASAIFGTPLVGFGLQLVLMRDFAHGTVASALILGGFYGLLHLLYKNDVREGLKLLSRIFLALSLLFLTLAVPFAFNSQTTAPLWAMEAVALLWMRQRTGQRFYGYAGVIVLALSNLLLVKAALLIGNFNGFYVSCLIVSLAHFAASKLLTQTESTEGLDAACSLAGMAWWLVPGCREVNLIFPTSAPYMTWLLFFTASACLGLVAHRLFAIVLLDKPASFLLPAIIAASAIQAADATDYHPLMGAGIIALPLAFGVHYAWLMREGERARDWQHALAHLTLIALGGFEAGYWLYRFEHTDIARLCGWMLAAAAGMAALPLVNKSRAALAGLPLAGWLCLLCAYSLTQPGAGAVPLFNLVELTELAAIGSVIAFLRRDILPGETQQSMTWVTGALAFGFVTAVLLRAASHFLGLIYLSDAMLASPQVETLLTLLWTFVAMAAMLLSSRRRMRAGWSFGAALLAVVMAKLFFVDLADIGTLSRIVSFMGVGALTLLLGYLAPMPPKAQAYAL